MRYTNSTPKGGGVTRLPLFGAIALFGAAALGGCDIDRDILSVADPDKATLEDVADPENLPAVRAFAIGEFQVAYAGRGAAQDNSFILMSGLLADEYEASGSFPTRQEVDQRSIQIDNGTAQVTFRLMHRARRAAEVSADLHGENAPGTRPHAEAHNFAGFMYNAFAEMYCSGVPFSALPLEQPVESFGEPQTTAQMLETAAEWFQAGQSLAQEAGSDIDAWAAQVGLARALLNLGRYDEAADAVATVPTGFEFRILHSAATGRQWNGTWNFVNSVKRWRIANRAGGNGLPYRELGTEKDAAGNVIAEGDPRVVWFADGIGFDQNTPQFSQRKYPSNSSPTPVATGVEARLIEAEAALQRDDIPAFVVIHNELRETADLEPLNPVDVVAMSPEERTDLHFQERALWLWQTGHRLGDLRRLVRQYGRDAESVFPTGSYFKGGVFGTDVNFPVPIDEQNNPNFETCINREA